MWVGGNGGVEGFREDWGAGRCLGWALRYSGRCLLVISFMGAGGKH